MTPVPGNERKGNTEIDVHKEDFPVDGPITESDNIPDPDGGLSNNSPGAAYWDVDDSSSRDGDVWGNF